MFFGTASINQPKKLTLRQFEPRLGAKLQISKSASMSIYDEKHARGEFLRHGFDVPYFKETLQSKRSRID